MNLGNFGNVDVGRQLYNQATNTVNTVRTQVGGFVPSSLAQTNAQLTQLSSGSIPAGVSTNASLTPQSDQWLSGADLLSGPTQLSSQLWNQASTAVNNARPFATDALNASLNQMATQTTQQLQTFQTLATQDRQGNLLQPNQSYYNGGGYAQTSWTGDGVWVSNDPVSPLGVGSVSIVQQPNGRTQLRFAGVNGTQNDYFAQQDDWGTLLQSILGSDQGSATGDLKSIASGVWKEKDLILAALTGGGSLEADSLLAGIEGGEALGSIVDPEKWIQFAGDKANNLASIGSSVQGLAEGLSNGTISFSELYSHGKSLVENGQQFGTGWDAVGELKTLLEKPFKGAAEIEAGVFDLTRMAYQSSPQFREVVDVASDWLPVKSAEDILYGGLKAFNDIGNGNVINGVVDVASGVGKAVTDGWDWLSGLF